nr:hypothetical protein [Tanacetum cinerariifolium]
MGIEGISKDASEGFDQIVDFLNAHVIQYALMVNPTIYVSCIKKFWTFVSIKKTNDVVRLQALIDRKKVLITEDTIRQALRLDDADRVDCLPNEEIFVELARMGYEKPSTKLTIYKVFFLAQWKFLIHIILQCMSANRTAWNEFSSSMASSVICLATGRKFNFSKYIFDSLYTSPALTQKVFANMRRIGKGFSGVDTPLFYGMLVQQQSQDVKDVVEDENDDNEVSDEPTPPSPTPTIPSSSPTQEHIHLPQAQTTQPSSPPPQQPSQTAEISMTFLNILLETYATLTKQVANLEQDKGRLEESQAKVYHMDLQYAEKVHSMQDTDEAEPAEVEEVIKVVTTVKLIIENNVVDQVRRKERQNNTIMRYQALKRKSVDEAQERKNMMVHLKNMDGLKMDFFRGMTYTNIRPIFENNYNLNQAFLERVKEEVIEELKTHLQIVPNDDDDTYTEATPLALKVPVVDYQIHYEHNKPYYKIRADRTHQLFLSFITLLKNFNREDLEMLWKLVQE